MPAFLNCIAMLKTVQSKKEDATRVIYESELSVLKNTERHGKRSTNLKKKDTVKKYEFKEKSDLMF